MGRRGNQTFQKNQKAAKRIAKANAKRAERQGRRDDKAARAVEGEATSGPPIDWSHADGVGPPERAGDALNGADHTDDDAETTETEAEPDR